MGLGLTGLGSSGGGGKMGQIVQAVKTDSFTTASATYVDVTGLNATITPTATSSKVLVEVVLGVVSSSDSYLGFFNIQRNGTTLSGASNTDGGQADTDNAWASVGGQVYTQPERVADCRVLKFIDEPSSTSALTYKVQALKNTAGSVEVNSWQENSDLGGISSITLTEILA
jgi:hypothetical protein